jgi:hypothetical protein
MVYQASYHDVAAGFSLVCAGNICIMYEASFHDLTAGFSSVCAGSVVIQGLEMVSKLVLL